MINFSEIRDMLDGIKNEIGHDVVISISYVDEKLSIVFSFYRARGLMSLGTQTFTFDDEDFRESPETTIGAMISSLTTLINGVEV